MEPAERAAAGAAAALDSDSDGETNRSAPVVNDATADLIAGWLGGAGELLRCVAPTDLARALPSCRRRRRADPPFASSQWASSSATPSRCAPFALPEETLHAHPLIRAPGRTPRSSKCASRRPPRRPRLRPLPPRASANPPSRPCALHPSPSPHRRRPSAGAPRPLPSPSPPARHSTRRRPSAPRGPPPSARPPRQHRSQQLHQHRMRPRRVRRPPHARASSACTAPRGSASSLPARRDPSSASPSSTRPSLACTDA